MVYCGYLLCFAAFGVFRIKFRIVVIAFAPPNVVGRLEDLLYSFLLHSNFSSCSVCFPRN